jgi:hypothetical protein
MMLFVGTSSNIYTIVNKNMENLRLNIKYSYPELGSGLWCVTPLSTIFQFYRDNQFYWWRKLYLKKTTDLSQVTDKLNVFSTPRYERIRTHNFSGDRH